MREKFKIILDVVSSLALIAAAITVIWVITNRPTQPTRQQPVVQVSEIIASKYIRNSIGNGNIAIIEFSDYQCPYCAAHEVKTFPVIREKFANDIKYIVLHSPIESIHPLALSASIAAECAAKTNNFWEMHHNLFKNAKHLEQQDLLKYADDIGLDTTTFNACLESSDILKIVRDDIAEAKRLGVGGTPAFFIGIVNDDGSINVRTKFNGALPLEEFSKAIDKIRRS